MADPTLHDERDFTRCTRCHSPVTPYDNTSLTRLSHSLALLNSKFKSLTLTTSDLAATSTITAALLSHAKHHCAKCGLFIELHPSLDEDPALSTKLFICSARNPHNYCLCHHCGLLYGVNPNPNPQTQSLTVEALARTLRSKLDAQSKSKSKTKFKSKWKPKKSNTEVSTVSTEVIDANVSKPEEDAVEVDEEEGDHSSSEVSASKDNAMANYYNPRLQSLKRKLDELSNITGRASWPPSPSHKGGVGLSLNVNNIKDSPSAMSAATPSPPFLEIRDSGAKWRLAQSQMAEQSKHKGAKGKNTKKKLKAQKERLQELEEMQQRMRRRKKVDTEELRKLLRSGKYPGAGRGRGRGRQRSH